MRTLPLDNLNIPVALLRTESGAVASSIDNSAGLTWNIPVTGTDATAHTWLWQIDGNTVLSMTATGNGGGSIGARSLTVGGNFSPVSNDLGSLGISGTAWADLFLAVGGVINWGAGDVLITHSANLLAFTGASSGYTFDVPIGIASGGTGSATAADARTALGLGTIATQNANNVTITGGSITGITDLAIADGGTGLSTLPTGLLIGAGTGAITAATYVPWTTFTPTVTLVGGAGNTVPQYVVNTGRYQQVGNRVDVEINLSGDGGNEGAGTGQMNIALPVAASANWVGVRLISGNYINGATNDVVNGTIAASATTVSLGLATGIVAFTGATQNNATRSVTMAFWYEV